ncbi:MAG: response regulator [Blastocatellia bacterium]
MVSQKATQSGLLVGAGLVAASSEPPERPQQAEAESDSAIVDLVWHDLKLQILDRVNLILASTVDAEVALQETVTLFQQVFGHRGCAVYLADDRQESLTLVAASGDISEAQPNSAAHEHSAGQQTISAQYSTPLWRGEEIIGLLRVDGSSAGEFREHELEAIEIFARQSSVALRQVIVAREARAERKRFLDLYANAQDGYLSFLADGTIIEVNQTQLEWLGYRREEFFGRWRVADLLIASGATEFPEFLNRLRVTGRAMMETEQICRDGRTLPVRIHARADFDLEGELTQAHATVRDISTEKLLLSQLVQARKEDTISHLVSVLAHEFNNLLTGIIGFNALARRQIGPQHRASRHLIEIERAAKGAFSLVTQLLAYGRSQFCRPEPVDLNQLMRTTTGFLESALSESVVITYLPGECAGTINADQEMIQQVVLSLCASAHRTDREHRELIIETGHLILDEQFALKHPGARPGSYHFIRLTDSGGQLDEKMWQQLSDEFCNLRSCDDSNSLRLTMAQEIIRNHEGYLITENDSCEGITFTICLPALRTPARTAAAGSASARAGGETILVVDDEPMVSRLLQEMLSGYGYRIVTAGSGQEALNWYRTHSGEVDLVITDVVMPGLQGPELCREIQRLNPHARLLLTSGYSTSEELHRLIDEGVAYIQKPWQGDDLVAGVRRVLAGNNPAGHDRKTEQLQSSESSYARVDDE